MSTDMEIGSLDPPNRFVNHTKNDALFRFFTPDSPNPFDLGRRSSCSVLSGPFSDFDKPTARESFEIWKPETLKKQLSPELIDEEATLGAPHECVNLIDDEHFTAQLENILKNCRVHTTLMPTETMLDKHETNTLSGLWRMLEAESLRNGFPLTYRGYNVFEDDRFAWLERVDELPWNEREQIREKCEKWLSIVVSNQL